MPDETPRTRRRLVLIGSIVPTFVIGVATGALATSAAASRAAQVAVDGSRRLFVSDQEARLAQAWTAGDAKIAVVLERLGRPDEASRRLALATKVGGQDAAWWRGLGLKIVGISLPQGFLHPGGTVRP